MNKVCLEHSYGDLYAKMLLDFVRDDKLSTLDVRKCIASELEESARTMKNHDYAERLRQDYDAFCEGNIMIARAAGINLFILTLFAMNRGEFTEFKTPIDYLERYLLSHALNDASMRLVQDYFTRFPSAPAKYLLEKVYNGKLLGVSNKTRFAIEACIRPRFKQ